MADLTPPPDKIPINAWIENPGNVIDTARLVVALRDSRELAEAVVEYFELTGCPKCCRGDRTQNCLYHTARRLLAQWKEDRP